jgi:hypothetical protein
MRSERIAAACCVESFAGGKLRSKSRSGNSLLSRRTDLLGDQPEFIQIEGVASSWLVDVLIALQVRLSYRNSFYTSKSMQPRVPESRTVAEWSAILMLAVKKVAYHVN